MNFGLENKTALVCGASQGIGKATALLLAEHGCNVILLARNKEKLLNVKEELTVNQSQRQQHYIIDVDLAKHDLLNKKLNQQILVTPNISIVINNAGGPAPGPAYMATTEDYIQAFNQHLLANQIILQAVLSGMQLIKYGRIINVISTSVKQPITGLGVSNTIRGAVANWAKSLANELGPHNITVNNILPGATETQRLEQIFLNKSKKQNIPVDQIIENEKSQIPLRRFAKAHEIASAIVFLASESAGYINGINLPVDGGRTLCL